MIQNSPACKRIAICVAAVLLLPSAWAAGIDKHQPPPGLYRVDTVDKSTFLNGAGPSVTVQTQADGESGDAMFKGQRSDGAPAVRNYDGKGATTVCISSEFNGAAMPNLGSCRSGPGVPGKAGITFTMHCDWLDMTTVVRQIDDKTWESRFSGMQKGPTAGSVDDGMAQMRRMFELANKNASAAQRAEAARALADFEARSAVMKQALARPGPAAAGRGAYGIRLEGVQRLTRIADRCDAGARR